MADCVACCCAECGRGVKSIRCELQSCMPTTKKDGPIWMRSLVCALNVFLTPWCLMFHCVRIYVVPCIYFSFCYADLLACCFPHWMFLDKEFPAEDKSLGALETSKEGVEWKRLEAHRAVGDEKPPTMKLFEGHIEAKDVCQGALGDCWLLSAIACMTEFHGAIQQIFYSHKANPRGKYYVELFDIQAGKWVTIVVDDLFPHKNGKLMFSQPNGDEEWVLILEKAFAKLCGSYHAIEGGLVLWAFQAMTGDAVCSYVVADDGKTWERLDMKPKPDDANKRKCGMFTTGEHLLDDAMYTLLVKLKHNGCVVGAGSRGKDNTITEGRGKTGGIVPGHAYSIIDAKHVESFRLVKLRNPWGTFEWDGDWGDKSELWATHKHVAWACGWKKDAPDDGTFWMSWEDFVKYFDGLDVCFRTQGMRELQFEVAEECGACGPFVGGLYGIGRFFCLCQGLYKMWCVRKGTEEELEDFEKGTLKASDIKSHV